MPSAQDVVDASEHYHGEQTQGSVIPSLLSIIIDTNPRAWSALNSTIKLREAVANVLFYANTHLACDNANDVSVIAAHSNRAVWLYPTPPRPNSTSKPPPALTGNEFPKFAEIKHSVFTSLDELVNSTTELDVQSTTTTQISGALSLALAHINKTSTSLTAGRGVASLGGGASTTNKSTGGPVGTSTDGLRGLTARIVVLSVSDSNPAQYISTMNAVFAAAHSQIPIDTLSLVGNPTFLQQASYLTKGIFIRAKNPRGIIQYLMFGLNRPPPSFEFASETSPNDPKKSGGAGAARGGGRAGTPFILLHSELVDFRAACFCHRRVVDTGFVCSVCLSIFCKPPPEGECLTCKSKLQLGNYGAKPVVREVKV